MPEVLGAIQDGWQHLSFQLRGPDRDAPIDGEHEGLLCLEA